jgi:ABC-2 type transport system ATP-binding protein
MTGTTLLSLHQLTKRFGDLQALDRVDLTVERGQMLGFLGPNGAGKTTTMRAIMGLITLDGGEVRWKSQVVREAERRRFGYMPAERGMYPKMAVREQLIYFARLAGVGRAASRRAADEWMGRLDIDGRADDPVQSLSSGNQQRVQLAISLVHDPELLILDEPFSGLDPVAVETMSEVIADQLRKGVAVLFSSHQLDLVSSICRDVAIIERGRIVLHGDVAQLRQRSSARYVTVGFATDEPWQPAEHSVGDAVVISSEPGRTRLRVVASTDPAALLAAATSHGIVTEFSFTPPDLSEVFRSAMGGHGTRVASDSAPEIGAGHG